MAVTEKCGLWIVQRMPSVGEDEAVTEVQTLQTFGLAAGTGQLADGKKLSVGHVELDRHPVGDDEHVQLLRPLLRAAGSKSRSVEKLVASNEVGKFHHKESSKKS